MDSRDIEKWRVELDSYAHVEDGVEYWLARDLMEPMGYTRWENFAEVIKRAKVSCETNKTPVDSHFRDTTKMVSAGVAARAVKDYKLTRYACYLIAQNGDSNKPEIALAQAYFAVQTRRFYRPPGQARLVKRLCPFGFDPMKGQQKRRSTEVNRLNILWWAVRGSACFAGGRCGASRLARCASKCLRISSAPRPFGFDPMLGQQKSDQPKPVALTCFGGPSGGRTLDLGIKSPLLYQLS